MLLIRSAVPEDFPALAEVFFAAVREGALGLYSEEQCRAWCPKLPSGPAWAERLGQADILLVAEVDNAVAGYMSLITATGYLDMAFVRPRFQRQGVASALHSVLEGRARALGLTRLDTEASLLAEPVFLRLGWQVIKRQDVVRRGVSLRNAWMEKKLG